MKKIKKNFWTREKLLRLGIPAVLIPGIMIAIILGWKPEILTKTKDYHTIQAIFPKEARVRVVIDGDNLTLESGVEVRLLAINAPGRGEEGFEKAKETLTNLVKDKKNLAGV